MKIESVIGALDYDDTKYAHRLLTEIDTVMYHRCNDHIGSEDAIGVAEWFKVNGPQWINSTKMPYTFVVLPDGRIQQTTPINAVTPHGINWNRRAISVMFYGDFRSQKVSPDAPAGLTAPPSQQVDAGIWLTRRLFDYFRRPLKIIGHSSAQGAAGPWGAKHNCPGDLFPINDMIAAVRSYGDVTERL